MICSMERLVHLSASSNFLSFLILRCFHLGISELVVRVILAVFGVDDIIRLFLPKIIAIRYTYLNLLFDEDYQWCAMFAGPSRFSGI